LWPDKLIHSAVVDHRVLRETGGRPDRCLNTSSRGLRWIARPVMLGLDRFAEKLGRHQSQLLGRCLVRALLSQMKASFCLPAKKPRTQHGQSSSCSPAGPWQKRQNALRVPNPARIWFTHAELVFQSRALTT